MLSVKLYMLRFTSIFLSIRKSISNVQKFKAILILSDYPLRITKKYYRYHLVKCPSIEILKCDMKKFCNKTHLQSLVKIHKVQYTNNNNFSVRKMFSSLKKYFLYLKWYHESICSLFISPKQQLRISYRICCSSKKNIQSTQVIF